MVVFRPMKIETKNIFIKISYEIFEKWDTFSNILNEWPVFENFNIWNFKLEIFKISRWKFPVGIFQKSQLENDKCNFKKNSFLIRQT